MLEASHSLHIFGVGFQLYSQLKHSLHDSMRVLGRSAVLMASQTTKLDKGNSIMMLCYKQIFHGRQHLIHFILTDS